MTNFFELLFVVSAIQFASSVTVGIPISPSSIPTTFTSSLIVLSSLLQISCLSGIRAKVLPEIYWNTTNRIFRIDNTEHVFVVKIHDRVDFVCPYYNAATSIFDPADVQVMEIYSVSKWSYDYCALSQDSVLAGVCNNPFQPTYATIVFREYTPKPGGLEFKPGRSYYFISTSTGQLGGLQNKHGGLCSSKNMKVKFEIEPVDGSDPVSSRSVDVMGAAGGILPQTKIPKRLQGENGDDPRRSGNNANDVYSPGDPSRINGGGVGDWNKPIVTTPRMYEIHTRPEGAVVDGKRTEDEYGEQFGANAHRRHSCGSMIHCTRPTLVFTFILYHFLHVPTLINS